MAEYIPVSTCDFRARCWVCGTTRDKDGNITHRTGTWHERFHRHPWVREAEIEGWGRELRSVVVVALSKQMLGQQHGFRFPDVESLMPSGEWVKHTRDRAAVYADAAAWQDTNLRNKDRPDLSMVRLANVARDAFRKMQVQSPNRHLHVDHRELHRRITGER